MFTAPTTTTVSDDGAGVKNSGAASTTSAAVQKKVKGEKWLTRGCTRSVVRSSDSRRCVSISRRSDANKACRCSCMRSCSFVSTSCSRRRVLVASSSALKPSAPAVLRCRDLIWAWATAGRTATAPNATTTCMLHAMECGAAQLLVWLRHADRRHSHGGKKFEQGAQSCWNTVRDRHAHTRTFSVNWFFSSVSWVISRLSSPGAMVVPRCGTYHQPKQHQ
jgi:hypothetical protein